MSGATPKTCAEKMKPALRTIGILFLALAAGCAGVKETLPTVMAQTGPLIVDSSLHGRNQDGGLAAEPVAGAPTTATGPPRSQSPAKAAAPVAKAPLKVSASPEAVEQPRKDEGPPAAAKTPEPPLDVAALKTRLRDTHAIGVFTKLALKNQVDDLLKLFRAYHQSGQKTSVASLRQPYNMLVLKVLSLVQDSDPSLARTLSGSREAIWGILADPEKFNSVT